MKMSCFMIVRLFSTGRQKLHGFYVFIREKNPFIFQRSFLIFCPHHKLDFRHQTCWSQIHEKMPPKRAIKDSAEATAKKETATTTAEPRPKRLKKTTKVEKDIEEVTTTTTEGRPKRQKKTIIANDIEPEKPKIKKAKGKEKKIPIETVENIDEDDAVAPAKKIQKKAPIEKSKASKTKAKQMDGEDNAVAPAKITRKKAPSEKSKASKTKQTKDQETDGEDNVAAPAKITQKKAASEKSKATKTKQTKAQETNGEEQKDEVKKPKMANKTTTDWETIEYTCSRKNSEDKPHNLIISCWNVGGLKSWVGKGCLEYLEHEKPDIFCMQETKCSEEKLPDEIKSLKLYKQYWCASKKEGYAGVALLTIKDPIKVTFGIEVPDLDEDGRCITAEYDQFFLVCVYVPNAGRKLVTLPKRLEWNKAFKEHVLRLEQTKPVIICGDMNVSHHEIDLARPASNKKNAGFTQEERDGMTELLEAGYVDTFRRLHPDQAGAYTFWTYMANARAKNVGWRLDYFITSEKIMPKVCDNVIRSEIAGSDHCPITLFININAEGPRKSNK